MKDIVARLKKTRMNESSNVNGNQSKAKQVAPRTSIQQTQGSNILIKKETPNRRSYLNK